MSTSAAADEFNAGIAKNNRSFTTRHPEDEANSRSSSRSRGSSAEPHSSCDEDHEHRGRSLRSGRDRDHSAGSIIEPSKDMPMFRSFKSPGSTSHNTGVKGVIADAHSYEKHRRSKRTVGHNRSASIASHTSHNSRPGSSSGFLDGENSSDEEIMAVWRRNRLAELKAAVSNNRRLSPSKRHYGTVERVDASGYLDAIEKVGRDTVVVVCIYNDSSSESRFVEDCMSTLARRYATTRFVKLHYDEAEMDTEVVPAILAYKNGELVANLPRVVDEVPPGRALSSESLETVLKREGVLKHD